MKITALTLSLAFCAAPLAAAADQIRLLAFGDSLTAGYGLAPNDGLVPRLQDWLHARGHDVVVINAGVSGETTAGGRMRIDAVLAHHAPDAVMVELGGNDLMFGLGAKGAEGNLDTILSRAGRGNRPLLLVGIAKPEPNERLRTAWAEIWPRLAERHDTLLYANLYAPLFGLSAEQLPAMLQEDGTHPSKQGVDLIVEGLGPKVEELLSRTEQARAKSAGG